MFDIPILFLVYNRPQHTKKVLEVLEVLQPRKLYVAADGPKNTNQDIELCNETRSVIKSVNWKCEISYKYCETNKSCKIAVSEAISWFFEHEEMGIILEDDCLPDLSFFTFCKELLLKYKDNENIMHINGSNHLQGRNFNFKNESYYFSKLPHPWGWATWRRAWRKYDIGMNNFESFMIKNIISSFIRLPIHQQKWIDILKRTKNNQIDTWDYQWFYSIWSQRGLVITPVKNLVTNIGFGNLATNTTYTFTKMGNRKRYSINSIVHPGEIMVNHEADNYATMIKMTDGTGALFQRVIQKIKLIIKNLSRK